MDFQKNDNVMVVCGKNINFNAFLSSGDPFIYYMHVYLKQTLHCECIQNGVF